MGPSDDLRFYPRVDCCGIFGRVSISRESLLRALNLAARAPSPHNTQPWRVEQIDSRVDISLDPGRLLRHGDPARRDAGLALGAFGEALRIGLAVEGVAAEVVEHAPAERLRLELGRGEVISDAKLLASLVRRRQSSRLPYSPREPAVAELEALQRASATAGLELHLVPRGVPERLALRDWLFAASRESWLDLRATKELARWTKLDPEGLRAPEEGLSTHALGLTFAQSLALEALLQPAPWKLLGAAFAAPVLAGQLATAEVLQAEQAPLFGIWIAQAPARDAGAALLRAWLEVARAGFSLHPVSVLLDRRGWELGRQLGLDPRRLAMVFRLGKSVPPPYSGRRPAERFARLSA